MDRNKIDNIEDPLNQYSPMQLLELLFKIKKSNALTAKSQQEIREITLILFDKITKNEKEATQILKRNGKQLLDIFSKAAKDKSYTDEQRTQFNDLSAILAGFLMSGWLPKGAIRKILMFLFILIGITGAINVSAWFCLLIFFGFMFSPRITAEVLSLIGSISGNQ